MLVTANLATHKARRSVLPKMLRSVAPQVDKVRCYVNDYKGKPLVDGVEFLYGQDLTDRGKFYGIKPGEIAFTMDDDLLYPPDYVERTLQALQKYPNAIVSYHGRKLKGKGLNYYFGHRQFHCLRTVEHDTMIDIPGSGVSAWNTNKFMPDITKYDDDCMADVLLGLEAAKAGVKVICLAHDTFWLRSLWNPNKGSIYNDKRDDCERQGELCDRIWDMKYGARERI